MPSVTQRINAIKQPPDGYLSTSHFSNTILKDRRGLHLEENIAPSLVGLAVDNLTRYMMSKDVQQAFRVSYEGAKRINREDIARRLLAKIEGLDDTSIVCAVKLCGFDVCIRGSMTAYQPVERIRPDNKTVENIRIMVLRCLRFWALYGPVVKYGFTFEGGYTQIVSSGDGDYLTNDTLWELKVSRYNPTSKQTLQLLVYYIMGMNSIHPQFEQIQYLGIYNPRQNIVYRCRLQRVPIAVIRKVREDVIGYRTNPKGITERQPRMPKVPRLPKVPRTPKVPRMAKLPKPLQAAEISQLTDQDTSVLGSTILITILVIAMLGLGWLYRCL